MKISYDPKVDAAYICLIEGAVECRAHELSEDVLLNIGPNQELVGIEILNASKVLHLEANLPTVEVENFRIAAAS